jgi:uncharacterized RDD family membrane protein YckC
MESRVGFWPRLGAYFIDTVLVCAIGALLASTIAGLFPEAAAAAIAEATKELKDERGRAFVEGTARFGVALGLVSTIYFLTEAFAGWTVGKLILGLRIGRADSVKRATAGQLAGRYAIKHLSGLLGAVALLSGIMVFSKVSNWVGVAIVLGCFLALGRARQTIYDLVVRTAVYRKTDLEDAEDQPKSGGDPTAPGGAAGPKWI